MTPCRRCGKRKGAAGGHSRSPVKMDVYVFVLYVAPGDNTPFPRPCARTSYSSVSQALLPAQLHARAAPLMTIARALTHARTVIYPISIRPGVFGLSGA